MVNTNMLREKITERGLSIQTLSEKMQKTHRATIYRKLNGSIPFTVSNADEIIAILNLSKDEALAVFFNQFTA
jgi:hypothetical protein